MAFVLVPVPKERLEAGRKVSPLAMFPPLCTQGTALCAPPAELLAKEAAIRDFVAQEGEWLHSGDFTPPPGRITDLEFCLLGLTDVWLDACLQATSQSARGGHTHENFEGVDVLGTPGSAGAATGLLASHPAKACLIGYWGQKFAPAPRWPHNYQKPFINNARKLARSRHIALAKPIDPQTGRMRYVAIPTQAGFIRSIWLAQKCGTPDPLARIRTALASDQTFQPLLTDIGPARTPPTSPLEPAAKSPKKAPSTAKSDASSQKAKPHAKSKRPFFKKKA